MLIRRTIPLALPIVLFTAGVALAATINCPSSGSCYGTDYDDTIYGTDNYNEIWALSGSDRPVYGHNPNGGPGDSWDSIHLAKGYDTTYAGAGHDYAYGGANGGFGVDRLIGQTGDDYLADHTGLNFDANYETDKACGDDGNDQLHIDDGNVVDGWYGGAGSDYVHKDSNDEHNSKDLCHG